MFFVRFLLGTSLVIAALFLILLVLIQRGRGGGLTGALGGAGGQSAFGTKAGDVFTRITVGVAACWIGLCILALNLLGRGPSLFSPTLGGNAPQAVTSQTPPATPATPPTTPPATTPPAGGEGLVIPDQPPTDAKPAPAAGGDAPPAAAAPAPPAGRSE